MPNTLLTMNALSFPAEAGPAEGGGGPEGGSKPELSPPFGEASLGTQDLESSRE